MIVTGLLLERPIFFSFSTSGFAKEDSVVEATFASVSLSFSVLNITCHYRAIYRGFAKLVSTTGLETAGLSTVGASIMASN